MTGDLKDILLIVRWILLLFCDSLICDCTCRTGDLKVFLLIVCSVLTALYVLFQYFLYFNMFCLDIREE